MSQQDVCQPLKRLPLINLSFKLQGYTPSHLRLIKTNTRSINFAKFPSNFNNFKGSQKTRTETNKSELANSASQVGTGSQNQQSSPVPFLNFWASLGIQTQNFQICLCTFSIILVKGISIKSINLANITHHILWVYEQDAL